MSRTTALYRIDDTGSPILASPQQVIAVAREQLSHRVRRGSPLSSPKATSDYLTLKLGDRDFETFCCLFLDSRLRVIEFVELFRGTIDGAAVHPREVVREALARNAAAVVFCHGHPLCCVQGVTVEGKEGCGLAPKLQILSRRPVRQGAALLTSGTLRCSPEVAARACDGRAAA